MPYDGTILPSTEQYAAIADELHTREDSAPEKRFRRMRAQIAAETSWVNTRDRSARTAPAREARFQKYLDRARELHAGYDVTDEFIQDVAERLRRIDMQRMALASAKARRAKTADRMRAAHEAGNGAA